MRQFPHSTFLLSGRPAAGLLAAICLAGLTGCSGRAEPLPATSKASHAREALFVRGDFHRELLLTGELEAVHAITVSAPQTSIFQMRIQFLAEEGEMVSKGAPLLDFDNSALSDRVLDLETQILDAETQVVAKANEIQSALKDLEIELAEREFEYGKTKLDASIEEGILSRKEYGERELAYTKAERELVETKDRMKQTVERGGAELDVLTIQRDKLQHDLLSAQKDLELLSIKAPSDGLVIYHKRQGSNVRFKEGDSCWPGQGILSLPDLSEMQVGFSVNEVDARLLEVGMPVEITMDSFPEKKLTGIILQIPSMAVNREDDSKVRIFKVVASLSETLAEVMKPGMSVLGRVVVDRQHDVPLVARHAVRFDGTEYSVRRPEDNATTTEGVTIHPVARNSLYYMLDDETDAEAIVALGLSATMDQTRIGEAGAGGDAEAGGGAP
jgi:HlyD family secretion protein